MATFSISLDIKKPKAQLAPVNMKMGDKESCIVVADITQNGAPYSLTGYTAYFQCKTPNNFMVEKRATISGNTLTCTLPPETAQVKGKIKEAYFALFKGTTYVDSTQFFLIDVSANFEDGSLGPSGEYIGRLEGVIEEGQEIIQEFEADAQGALDGLQSQYESAEAARDVTFNANEATRQRNETTRQTQESERVVADAKRTADTNAAIEALSEPDFVILTEGQFDSNFKPTIANPKINILYLVPYVSGDDNNFREWRWINNAWEFIGNVSAAVVNITTDEIDSVTDDESPSGNSLLSLTGLSYFWAKLKAFFAAKIHTHNGSDLTANSVTSTQIANGTILDGDISVNAAIAGSKLADASVSRAKIDEDFEAEIASLEESRDSISHLESPAFGKVLWSGNYASQSTATLEVPGISNYSMIVVLSNLVPCLCTISSSSVIGGGNRGTTNGSHRGINVFARISGDVLSEPLFTYYTHVAEGNHGAMSHDAITKIIGLF